MTRGRFYVFSVGNQITPVEGWKCMVSAQGGNSIDIGMYRPKYARYWNVVERSSGLSICTGRTRDEAIANAEHKAPAIYRIIEDAGNPEVNDPVTVRFREYRTRMVKFVTKDAEQMFE